MKAESTFGACVARRVAMRIAVLGVLALIGMSEARAQVGRQDAGPRAASQLQATATRDPSAPWTATASLSWTPAAAGGEQQRVLVTYRVDGFEWDDYTMSNALPPGQAAFESKVSGSDRFWWKVQTLHRDGWADSRVRTFSLPEPLVTEAAPSFGVPVVPIGLLGAACAPTFEDINDDNADIDPTDPDGASGGRCNGLATVAGNNQLFYTATEWGGVYRTNDGGLTWDRLAGHRPTACWDVEVDPSNANIVYATSFFDGRTTSESGIQTSTDGGNTWSRPGSAVPVQSGPGDNTPQAGYISSVPTEMAGFGIAIRPDAPQNVFIGTSSGLAISSDSGATWQFVDADATPGTANRVWAVEAQGGGPSGQGIIDVVTSTGHHRSTDGGINWTANNLPAASFTSLCSLSVSPDESYVLFVSGADGNLYESDDAGATWSNRGASDPIRGGSRMPMAVTNQRTNGFDLWTGGVSLYRVACTTPNPPMQGGAPRCPAATNPLTAGWFGGFTRGGLGAATGAHDDIGDVAFDATQAIDAVPRMMTSDGGVYFALFTSADPTVPIPGAGQMIWEQPNRTPHALWLFGMAGVDAAGDDAEDIYFGCQDNGTFANTNAGAANPEPSWHVRDCCDTFDLGAEDDRVLYTQGAAGCNNANPCMCPRRFQLNLGTQGLPGFASTQINTYPAGGLVTTFNFAESIANWGDHSYAVLTNDCTNANGCPGCPGGSDGGLFITTDITASPIVWTELGNATEPNSAQMVWVQVAFDSGGTPTFYVSVGGGNAVSADQLWKFVGTNPAGAWTRIDINIPGATGVTVWAVDRNDPARLYAAALLGASPFVGMFRSDNGGANWTADPDLDNMMTGGGAFPYANLTGPTNFFGFGGYPQPSLVAFDPENPELVIAGGRDSGIFISRNGGARWGLLTDPLELSPVIPHIPRPFFAHFDHDTGDPNLVRIIVGTLGFGVWRITLPIDVPVVTIPGDVNFGLTCVGSFATATLNVCNTGTANACASLMVTNITSSSPQFEVVEPTSGYPVVISHDFCFPFQVKFTPTSPGPRTATITVFTNDPVSPSVTVQATGTGGVPDITFTGLTDFGDVCPEDSASATVSICNTGPCDLHVTSVAFDPPCPDFTIVNNPFPATISHDFCLDLVILFTPTSIGPKSCTLKVFSDDPDEPILMITVTANTPAAMIDVPPDLSFPPEVIQSVGPCNTQLPFPISNTGTCDLVITEVAIITNQAEYSVVALPSYPIILEPGHIVGEGDLRLQFAPLTLGRDRMGQVRVTYLTDPITGASTSVTRDLCGEGVNTGARVLVTSLGVPLAQVKKIQLHRVNANQNGGPLDSIDVVQNAQLVTISQAAPCSSYQFQREYGTVDNPVILLPGVYRLTVMVRIGNNNMSMQVGFSVDTCDFNQTIVVNFP